MMNETGLRRVLPDQSLGSGHTLGTHHPSITNPILSKRVCFYKSGDPQFNGLNMVINNRTFKTFDALLDSLSKKVPLPFGVRNITTPRGVHAVYTLDELEDGKSYICSDSRKVKPINLALARKKPPPWYHARPVSARRQTVQQARFFPGRSVHKQEVVSVRTPKRLLVFRNGDPTVKHSVVLHKRTARTFESVLEYISQMIQFHVVKLHTADGRRVDGLPALILCSGTVVAVGREPFRPANYTAQKSPAPAMLPTKQMGHRRLKRKKKSLPYSSKSRNFSPSSERYIVNQIHNSIAESSCDLPSRSVELESGRILESVPETPDTCLGVGAEEQDGFLPAEDDIEKSFRVNQDGSMTVEMRVRLTIKEEETVHWTTTLARSSIANQLNVSHLPEPNVSSLDLQSPIDTMNKDKYQDNNDEDPPSPGNGSFSENSCEEGDVKVQTAMASPRRVPTPGHKQIRKKQASVESIKSVTTEGIQEDRVGSYSYREQTEDGAVTEQYCMVKQSSSRPVPKPRRLGSVEANMNSSNISTFKSAEMTETLQLESSGEEVTETVLHVYEQQTCQDNFFANLLSQGTSASGVPLCRPATSETGQLSSSMEFEPQLWRPSTASESVSVWRAESSSITSDLTLHSQRTGGVQATEAQQQSLKPTKGKGKPQQRDVSKEKRVPTKPKVINTRIRRLATPGKKRKENSAGATEKSKTVKTFSSAGFIKKIYGGKSKAAKGAMKLKKGTTQNRDEGVTTMSSQQSDDTMQCLLKDTNVPSASTETTSETVPVEKISLGVAPSEVNQARGILTRQTSMHQEKQNKNKSCDVSGSMSLPPFNSSSSVTREYVENWLEKAQLDPSASPDEESKMGDTVKDTSGVQTLKPTDLPPEIERRASVKQRIQSFEKKSSSPPTTVHQQVACSRTISANTENYKIKPVCSEIIPPANETSTEMPSGSETKPSPIQITLSMELPLPPPPAENTELSNTDYCMLDASSVPSSPLYRLSSVSSRMSDNQPLPISPTSDKAASPTEHSMEMTTSIQQREALSPRSPPIKRASLDSNTSQDITDHKVLPNGTCSTGTQPPRETPPGETQQSNSILNLKSSPSCCTSASPTSSTSEERVSTTSISSTPSDLPFKATKTPLLTEKEESSPKPLVKNVKLMSPSQTKKLSAELPHHSPKLSPLHNHPPDKTMSPNIKVQRRATPNASPTSERKLYRPKTQKRLSPYSQSLDMASPPVRHKSSGRRLMRNLPSDEASDPTNKTQRKTLSQRKGPNKTTAELDQTPTCNTVVPLEADQSHENKEHKVVRTDKEESITQIMPPPLNVADQPNMRPVLERICYSIKSIRQITQSKRPSCLEKSNSLPDFSSHVASTFGSSSKALLAFLSVMTLKKGLTDLDMDELNANNVSCAEALKMIDSLREIASIEDSHELKVSLVNLQQSASKQLLQSWKGFQDLGEKSKSQSSTPKDSDQSVVTERDCGVDENIINEIVENLDIPEKLKEELTSLTVGVKCESDDEEEMEKVESKDNSKAETSHFSTADTSKVMDVAQDEKVSVDVSSIIKKFTDINQPKQSMGGLYGQNGKCPPAEHQEQGHSEDKPNHEKAKMNGVVSSKRGLEQDSCMHCENESTHDDESGSDEEGQTKDLEQKESLFRSETGDQHSSEEEPEAESEKIRQERRGSDDPSAESHSEEEEVKQPSSNFYTELNVEGKEGISSSDSETKYLSEEEQPKSEYKKLKVIIEESLSGGEEEEEVQFVKIPNQGEQIKKCLSLIEEKEEDMVSSDEDRHAHKTLTYNEPKSENTVENQDSYSKKDNTSLTKSYGFDADEDSGNDHSSCDEHVEVEQPKVDLSYDEKESSSDEEHDVMDRYIDESCAEYQEAPALVTQSKDAKSEKAVDKLKQQSVAERVILLEKQVAQRTKGSSGIPQRNTPLESDVEDSLVESPTSRSTPGSRSAPQSSLSFSYDSSGVITTEPEGNRVRSIREMFLAKSATDIQRASELRAETSASGGYQSQTSSELSSGEEDTARKSITKGFVRRTIERLYGKKEAKSDEEAGERPPSASKQKKKEHSSMFSPFHTARAKAMSELSYFSSTNTLDTLSGATRCVAFNTQVRPEDSVPADDEQWLLRENTMIRKSLSDPVGINKNLINSPPDKDTEEDAPYSLFSSKSEPDDKKSSFSRKCTYFSLPHASDSDAFQDELSIVSKSSVNGDSITEMKDITEDAKTWEERNGALPGAAMTDFKMMDNKVHPLPPPDGEVVVVQPGKGQGVMSRIQEPDMLDILYNFCGQNCPIL